MSVIHKLNWLLWLKLSLYSQPRHQLSFFLSLPFFFYCVLGALPQLMSINEFKV